MKTSTGTTRSGTIFSVMTIAVPTTDPANTIQPAKQSSTVPDHHARHRPVVPSTHVAIRDLSHATCWGASLSVWSRSAHSRVHGSPHSQVVLVSGMAHNVPNRCLSRKALRNLPCG